MSGIIPVILSGIMLVILSGILFGILSVEMLTTLSVLLQIPYDFLCMKSLNDSGVYTWDSIRCSVRSAVWDSVLRSNKIALNAYVCGHIVDYVINYTSNLGLYAIDTSVDTFMYEKFI